MAARLSTGLVNHLMADLSFNHAFANSLLDVYSGGQPVTADSAATGTLLVTLSNASGAPTAETKATGSMTLATGAAGSVNTVTVNGIDILGSAVAYNTSLAATAVLVAAQINRNPANKMFEATVVGAVITLTAYNGLGTLPNGWVVSSTLTTLTASYTNLTGGVAAVNSLLFDNISSPGVAQSLATQVWSGVAIASGTAGWMRLRGSGDSGVGATTTADRFDGAVATSGAEMNIGSLTVTLGAPFALSSATFTLPQL